MTASSVESRPTVEDTAKAHAAFSWAFRGGPDQSLACLSRMDLAALHAVRLAGALIAAQADQILGGGA